MLRILPAVLAATLTCGPAWAHDVLANGEPVPAWIKSACCGVSDFHHLRPNQVHVVPGGYKFDGYRDTVGQSETQPSPDGEIYVFYRDYPDGSQSHIYCAFLPPQSF